MQNKLFIGGEFVDGIDGATIEVVNPHDATVITRDRGGAGGRRRPSGGRGERGLRRLAPVIH